MSQLLSLSHFKVENSFAQSFQSLCIIFTDLLQSSVSGVFPFLQKSTKTWISFDCFSFANIPKMTIGSKCSFDFFQFCRVFGLSECIQSPSFRHKKPEFLEVQEFSWQENQKGRSPISNSHRPISSETFLFLLFHLFPIIFPFLTGNSWERQLASHLGTWPSSI